MKLTADQLKALREYWLRQIAYELTQDKPFGTDEHPYQLADIVGSEEPVYWTEHAALFCQAFDVDLEQFKKWMKP